MPRKGTTLPRPEVGDPDDPDGLVVFMHRYLEWMRVQNYSPVTTKGREDYLRAFIVWCDARSLKRPNEITRPILERYQRYLYLRRKSNGEPLSFRSQYSYLLPLRGWFQWLTRQNHILYNPASELELPRLEKQLPKYILSREEAEQVLQQPDISTRRGLRDRAILETFYSTGMRRRELTHLKLYDIDPERGTVMIRQGKGRKDRLIPMGERALAWINRYRMEARLELLNGRDEGVLFLTHLGEAFTPGRMSQLVRTHIAAAKLGKTGSCHLFRHTMATLMLEHGADIRYIQEMLGHASVSTTQIYTRVSILQLTAIHSATHPGARLEKRKPEAGTTPAASETESRQLLETLKAEARKEDCP